MAAGEAMAKYELWYKCSDNACPARSSIDLEATNVRPDMKSKNGYHLVWIGNDPPKQLEPWVAASLPAPPKTPRELCNLLSGLDSLYLGKVVGQLLTEGRVSLQRFRYVLRRSALLAQVSEKLRRELLNIQENKPSEEEAEEGE